MRLILIIIIAIHGFIHLLGFFKAFEIIELKEISQAISKPIGIVWLIASILLVLTATLILTNNDYWWLFGFIALVVSQILIVVFWYDTKIGTIPNILLLLTSIIAFANFSFTKLVNTEISELLSNVDLNKQTIVTKEMSANLPLPVQNWLSNSGVIGKSHIQSVYLRQEALMKMKPEQENWYEVKAEQFFSIQPPVFNWKVNLQMNSILNVVGRDKFQNGKGEMLMKVLSLFPVVDVKENTKINQGALQRYLAEIVWFPTAALNQYISWESIDNYSAKATMTYNGTKGSGTYYFDKNGFFEKFIAMRYKDINEDAELKEWIIEVSKSEIINEIMIPIECKVTWKLENGYWTWLKLKITDIQYNIENNASG